MITVNTLPSYRLLLSSKYYNLSYYFWVPGALKDYDIPDLARLVSPVEQLWIDPLNALSESMTPGQATEVLGDVAGLQIAVTSGRMTDEIAEAKNGPENHLQVQESH